MPIFGKPRRVAVIVALALLFAASVQQASSRRLPLFEFTLGDLFGQGVELPAPPKAPQVSEIAKPIPVSDYNFVPPSSSEPIAAEELASNARPVAVPADLAVAEPTEREEASEEAVADASNSAARTRRSSSTSGSGGAAGTGGGVAGVSTGTGNPLVEALMQDPKTFAHGGAGASLGPSLEVDVTDLGRPAPGGSLGASVPSDSNGTSPANPSPSGPVAIAPPFLPEASVPGMPSGSNNANGPAAAGPIGNSATPSQPDLLALVPPTDLDEDLPHQRQLQAALGLTPAIDEDDAPEVAAFVNPEPATLVLFGSGLLVLARYRRSRTVSRTPTR